MHLSATAGPPPFPLVSEARAPHLGGVVGGVNESRHGELPLRFRAMRPVRVEGKVAQSVLSMPVRLHSRSPQKVPASGLATVRRCAPQSESHGVEAAHEKKRLKLELHHQKYAHPSAPA